MSFLIHYLFALFFAFLGRLVFTCLSLVFSSRFIFVFRFYALVVFYVSVSFYVGRSLSHVGFACAPLFIHSPFVFAIFFLTQLHVIVFWIYFSYFLQPPRFRFFFFSLLLGVFVLHCSLVAAFVFVLCLSHALVAVVFWCRNSRLSFAL